METKTINVPTRAMQFLNKQEKIIDSLQMLVYSVQVIKDHWYWNNLAIDLKGMSFPKNTFPILENHNVDRKIGFAKRSEIEVNGNLRITGGTFLDTEAAREFRRLSKEDFPYEASMYAKPTSIERINEGEEVEVNGMTVKGPVTIWRKSIFKEASLCVFGYDPETSAKAVSNDTLAFSVEIKGELDEDAVWINEMLKLARDPAAEKQHSFIEDTDVNYEDELWKKEMLELSGDKPLSDGGENDEDDEDQEWVSTMRNLANDNPDR